MKVGEAGKVRAATGERVKGCSPRYITIFYWIFKNPSPPLLDETSICFYVNVMHLSRFAVVKLIFVF